MCPSKEIPLEDLLPHKPPMILLSGYEPASFTETGLTAWVDITEDSIFYEEALGGTPSAVAVEYMAQTVACYVGLMQKKAGSPPKVGFVLGSRNLTLGIPVFLKGIRYRILSELLYDEDGFASFSVKIVDPQEKTVSEAVLNAFQPENPDVVLQAQEMQA